MITAYNLLQNEGREFADKVVVVFTDGAPNVIQSSTAAIDAGIAEVPAPHSGQFYTSPPLSWPQSRYWFNAPLLWTWRMHHQEEWDVFSVGIGFGADPGFSNKMAELGGTAEIGADLQAGGDPRTYEENLTKIFKKIIHTPRITIVD